MNYDHILDEMAGGVLPCTGFGHAVHLGTAHAALKRWEFFEAAHRYASAIRAAASAAGAPEKFNATLTLAFLCLIAERMGDEDSATFVAQNPDLGRDALLAAGYDAARLADPKARRVGLLPRVA
ncbi:hypothetical protein ATO6_05610 [Oceanicola sp. 22II-s10i]|uniref:hypothetical protein n=1 Tax=Oceanicola sp. 22II-s10i TaxID=1317116 RepID=UPI000B523B29|nr:hypothetical protein [Oceanicola sp. 22II-s10i]OWU86305.1 hypothetical protein ATO6_05610 [Oceanicola sp. 22II-s10i]